MSRKIIQVDEEKCIGCGLCTNVCKQNVIKLINGKAKVVHNEYCDGIGNCLPVCPVDAISFSNKDVNNKQSLPCGCPSSNSKIIERDSNIKCTEELFKNFSQLKQWPVQIKLVPENAPYFDNAHLLVAADCTAFAYGNFHSEFMKNKITIIGCPKLDEIDYTNKLTDIIKENNIKSITVIRMEVPCCGGIENAVKNAIKNKGELLPWQVITISVDGKILDS